MEKNSEREKEKERKNWRGEGKERGREVKISQGDRKREDQNK